MKRTRRAATPQDSATEADAISSEWDRPQQTSSRQVRHGVDSVMSPDLQQEDGSFIYPDEEARLKIEEWFAPIAYDQHCEWSAARFFASLPLGALLADALQHDLQGLRELGDQPEEPGRDALLGLLQSGDVLVRLVDMIWPALAKLSRAQAQVSAGLQGCVVPEAAKLKESCVAQSGDTLELDDEVSGE